MRTRQKPPSEPKIQRKFKLTLRVLRRQKRGKSTVTLTLNGLVPYLVPSDYRGSVLVAGQEVADADIAHLAGIVAMVM